MTASFRCCGTFPSRQVRVISRWSLFETVRSFCSQSSNNNSTGGPTGPTAFVFVIAFIDVATSSSVGSVPKALATSC